MSTIKISELATSNIALTDFFAKADATGLANKNTVQELSNLLRTVDDTAFKGSIAIADVPSENGWYFASESGTYTNCGGLVIDTTDNIAIIIVSGTFDTFNKIDIPVNITIDATPTNGSNNAVSSNGVFDALALKASLASPTFTGTVGGIDKNMIGLSNLDNTSDADKPISTATQTAIDNVTITTDAVPTEGSTDAVESGGTFDALYLKADAVLEIVQYNLPINSSFQGTGGDLSSAYYINADAKLLKTSTLKSITFRANSATDAFVVALKINASTLVVEDTHIYATIPVSAGTNTYVVTDNFLIPNGYYLGVRCGGLLFKVDQYSGTAFRSSNALTTATVANLGLSYTFEVESVGSFLTETQANNLYPIKENVYAVKNSVINYFLPDNSIYNLSPIDSAYYINEDSLVNKKGVLKKVYIRGNSTATATVAAIKINPNTLAVEDSYVYASFSVVGNTFLNPFIINDDFEVPEGWFIGVKCTAMYYKSSVYANAYRSSSALTTATVTTIAASYNFDLEVEADLVTEQNSYGFSKVLDKDLIDANNIFFYGTSIFSNDYTWLREATRDITNANNIRTLGVSGADAATNASDTYVSRLLQNDVDMIIAMTGGNDSGVSQSVGTFNGSVIGEPVVSETNININYNGTYFIQAISHMMRKMNVFYNIRTRAQLTGTETEAEKNDKIAAIKQVRQLFLTGLPKKITNAANANSLPENWNRKREAVIECGIKYGIDVYDSMNDFNVDMAAEPFYVGPTNKENNNGVYFMDGLHPNIFGYRKLIEGIFKHLGY
tara:strand:+ start:524 stop:2878 length:2355 start_codon:yes stop_codon:yes gene_type:complete